MAGAVRASVSPLPESVPPLLHGPPAVQEVALVELQVRVERAPDATGFGEAERLAAGAGAAGWFTEQLWY